MIYTREKLAEYAHDAWSGWMGYLFRFGKQNSDGTFTMDAEKVERWRRQMRTHYDGLSEAEKNSDRQEADQMLAIVAKSAEMQALLRVAKAAKEWHRVSTAPLKPLGETMAAYDELGAALSELEAHDAGR